MAQRVVLYEQQTNPQERKQYVGSVIWRTEMTSPGPGQPPDIAVKAEVEIPERHMRMSFTVRRNLDQSLPASHTIEILFSTPADFEPGGIADVPGVLMENTEQTRGAPLAGLRVKVTNGFFLVGLSSVESEMRRNVQMLKERPWLHVRMAYNNGQLALMAIEKGPPGAVYNIGARNERPNIEVVESVLEMIGKPRSLIRFVKDRPGHDRRYAIDPSLIQAELGWRPRETWEGGLQKTLTWYQENGRRLERARSGAYQDYYREHYGAEVGAG